MTASDKDQIRCDTCDQWVHKDKIADCQLTPCGLRPRLDRWWTDDKTT